MRDNFRLNSEARDPILVGEKISNSKKQKKCLSFLVDTSSLI